MRQKPRFWKRGPPDSNGTSLYAKNQHVFGITVNLSLKSPADEFIIAGCAVPGAGKMFV